MSHRLFVAIRPPEEVIETLLDTMEGVQAARWQDDDQLHVTLRFVGEVDGRRAEDLVSELGRVTAPRFPLEIAGVGHFERKGVARAIWARVMPSPALELLQRRVERACRAAGCAPETRKFLPHVTLARLNRSAGPIGGWLADQARLHAGPWEVDGFMLYESHVSDAGAEYEPVETFSL